MKCRHSLMLTSLAALLIVGVTGCDKEKVKENVSTAVTQARDQIDRTVETVKQEVNLAGSIDLSTSPPISSKACYVSLIVIGGDRGSILQLTSAKDETTERYPSIYAHARTDATTLSELAGKTLQAEVFAQESESGPMWFTDGSTPVTLKVSNVSEGSVTCELSNGRLTNTASGEAKVVTGKFLGLTE